MWSDILMEYIQINILKLKKEITLSNFFKTTRGTERAVIIERKPIRGQLVGSCLFLDFFYFRADDADLD